MQCSALSNSPKIIKSITIALRIIVGAVFVFSGFVKLVDPWGTIYKFGEYFSIWGMEFSRPIVLACAVGLSLIEFTSGVMLLAGAFKRTTAILLTLVMLVMTPLTLWIYVSNPVSDCGCFGDALVLSNGATLLKNIVLTVMCIWLLKFNHRVGGLIVPKVQWLASVATISYGVVIAWIGYNIQPLVDFRPYPVGTDMTTVVESVGGDDIVFVYQKDGQQHEFAADNLPDDDRWEFVGRKSVDNTAADAEHDFVLFDEAGQDVTTDAIDTVGSELMLMVSAPVEYAMSRATKTNELASLMEQSGGRLVAVIPSNYPGGIEAWREMTQSQYDVYQTDDTDIQMMARGVAAMVYIKDGKIEWKRNMYSLSPHLGAELADDPETLDAIAPIEHAGILGWLTVAYVAMMALIAGLGHMVRLAITSRRPAKGQVVDNAVAEAVADDAVAPVDPAMDTIAPDARETVEYKVGDEMSDKDDIDRQRAEQ